MSHDHAEDQEREPVLFADTRFMELGNSRTLLHWLAQQGVSLPCRDIQVAVDPNADQIIIEATIPLGGAVPPDVRGMWTILPW